MNSVKDFLAEHWGLLRCSHHIPQNLFNSFSVFRFSSVFQYFFQSTGQDHTWLWALWEVPRISTWTAGKRKPSRWLSILKLYQSSGLGHSYWTFVYSTGCFLYLFLPFLSTIMKNELQPNRTTFLRKNQCKTWLRKFLHSISAHSSFEFWKWGGAVKNIL